MQLYRLLVLVPHRDIRIQMQAYSEKLFSAGFSGAWSFPWVTPLAELSGPLSSRELKEIAVIIREQGIGRENKITCTEPAQTAFLTKQRQESNSPEKTISIFGPALSLSIPDSAFSGVEKKILHRFCPLVIGAALTLNDEPMPGGPSPQFPPPPDLSFRTAALANMLFRPLSPAQEKTAHAFKWKIDKLHWLPSS